VPAGRPAEKGREDGLADVRVGAVDLVCAQRAPEQRAGGRWDSHFRSFLSPDQRLDNSLLNIY
jgi:hypothetical protein